jgi:hypothetical protein
MHHIACRVNGDICADIFQDQIMVREAEEEGALAYALLRWADHVNEDIVK